MKNRTFGFRTVVLGSFCVILASIVSLAMAADFPDRPITVIVGMPAGDSADTSTRNIARAAEAILKQPVVIVNRTGGGATVATAAIATAKPDGYTLGTLLTSPLVTMPHFMKLTYHPVKDIQPIVQFGILNFAVSVRAESSFKTFKEMMAFAKANPGVVTYGTVGPTSAQYILMEHIAKSENAELVHVPFKGGGEAFSAALGGHITASAGFFSPGQVRAKKVRLLALFGDQRIDDFPDVPTLKELGYDVRVPYFIGIGAPRGVPEPILKKLEDAFARGMKDPAFIQGMRTIEMPMKYRNSSEFSQFLSEGYDAVGHYIEDLGLKKK
jgi:tripartite-type tricarboxylate transporter receptor subunit TctC